MARVSEAEVERLKREVSLERLVTSRGVKLSKHGDNLLGRCPFHDDKTPSLVVSPSVNLWHCLGACQAGGSVLDWVMKAEGVGFRHAVELLREGASLEGSNVVKIGSVRKLPAPVDASADDSALLRQVVDYYRDTLRRSPEAFDFLERRGLRNANAIEHFHLGFANRTLGLHLPMRNRQAGAELRGRLQKLGVIRESGHEHFNGSLVVPILDEEGCVQGMYGRKVTPGLRPGTPLHLYLPGPHRGVWNAAELGNHKSVILCEALLDALTFWCAGFRGVTASYGVEGFTAEHLEVLKAKGIEMVFIAYDRDEAGDKAAEKLAPKLAAEGFDVWRVKFPKGMDANEYAQKVKPVGKSFEVLLRGSEWMGKGKFKPVAAPTADSKPAKPSPSLAAAPKRPERETEPVNQAAEREAISTAAAAPVQTERKKEPVIPDSAMAILESMGTWAVEAACLGVASAAAESAEGMEIASTPRMSEKEEASSPDPAESAPKEIASSVGSAITSLSATVPSAPEVVKEHAPAAEVAPGGPAPKAPEIPAEVKDEEVIFTLGDRRYRVRGLSKNLSYEVLKVNLLVAKGEGFHVDALDLYSAKARGSYVKQASAELRVEEEVVKRDLGKVLRKLEELQEAAMRKALEPQKKAVSLSEDETAAALELLKAPDLLERILKDFERCGVVGEETNKLVGYLAVVSRKLEDPLAVIIQSSSAAGKTSLMEAVLAFVPEEDRVKYSAMTGQSLFYMGEGSLAHKVLGIVEEEGASRATYALKLLQSEGELTIASTGKDAVTGRLVTEEYRVEGPVQLFLTTTAIELDEELLNRCLVLTVDEDREQTRAIHRLQRESQTLEGLLAKEERHEVLALHRNAQRLLRPLLVANPFARELTFLDEKTRTRRDHMKYLTLIRTVALLHQHQREGKMVERGGKVLEYVEATLEDVAVANRLAHQVLGRSLDELPPQTRKLLVLLEAMVSEACRASCVERKDFRFTRKDVRAHTGWGDTQLKVHLGRLEELEYLAVREGGRNQPAKYELLYDGKGLDGTPFLAGLLDVEKLRRHYDARWSGQNEGRSEGSRPVVGGQSGGGRPASSEEKPSDVEGLTPSAREVPKNARLALVNGAAPYVQGAPGTYAARVP